MDAVVKIERDGATQHGIVSRPGRIIRSSLNLDGIRDARVFLAAQAVASHETLAFIDFWRLWAVDTLLRAKLPVKPPWLVYQVLRHLPRLSPEWYAAKVFEDTEMVRSFVEDSTPASATTWVAVHAFDLGVLVAEMNLKVGVEPFALRGVVDLRGHRTAGRAAAKSKSENVAARRSEWWKYNLELCRTPELRRKRTVRALRIFLRYKDAHGLKTTRPVYDYLTQREKRTRHGKTSR